MTEPTDMVKRMARAMCVAEGQIWDYSVDEPNRNSPMYSDSLREMYLAHARAALSVLQEPTDEMIESARMPIMETRGKPKDAISYAVFKAMIKAAGAEE